MNGLVEGLPLVAAAGLLCYLVAWALWSGFLSPSRLWDQEAEKRAGALLAGLLSERERRQLADRGYLLVPSPSVAHRVYRIPSRGGWVEVYESDKLAMKACVQPEEKLPAGDVVAMHKLLIEGNEREYLRRANIRWMRHGCGLCCLQRGEEGAGSCGILG